MSTRIPLLVEPEELLDHMDNNARIVDLSSEQSYLSGHIPGAIHLPYQALVLGQPPTPGLLPDISQLKQIFAYLGLLPNTHFFVYDDEGGGWAGRFIWTLDVIGHTHYSYINGGIHAWRAAGLDTESSKQTVAPTSPAININEGPQANFQEILAGLEKNTVTVWDARSPEENRGERVLAARGGHIPGAINCEWTNLMDPSRAYRIREDAQAYLASLGLTKEKNIVTHCQTHHRSGFTYLLGKILGFNIRAYPGSWSEWGNLSETPIETSAE